MRRSWLISRWKLISLCCLTCILHAYVLYQQMYTSSGIYLNVSTLFSLVCCVVVVGLCFLMVFNSVDILIIGVLPIAAFSLVMLGVFPIDLRASVVAPMVLLHIVLASLTYGVLCLASLIAILLALQEYFLRYKILGLLLQSLPPMQILEQLLFQLILAGWILLSCLLGVSFICFFSKLFFMDVISKVIMTVTSWMVFAVLCWGRFFYGWRGGKIIYGTLFGVSLIVLLYFLTY